MLDYLSLLVQLYPVVQQCRGPSACSGLLLVSTESDSQNKVIHDYFCLGTSPTESPTTTTLLTTDSSTTSTNATNPSISTNLPMTTITADPPMTFASRITDSATDIATQGRIISATNPEQSSSNIIGPAVGGAVGGLVVVITIIVVVVIIALLFIKRSQKGSLKVMINDRKESVQGYNNALYDGKYKALILMNEIHAQINITHTYNGVLYHILIYDSNYCCISNDCYIDLCQKY